MKFQISYGDKVKQRRKGLRFVNYENKQGFIPVENFGYIEELKDSFWANFVL